MKFSETLPQIEPAKFNDWQSLVQKILKTDDITILNKKYVNENLNTNFIYFKDSDLQNKFKIISSVIFDSYKANSVLRNEYGKQKKNELFTAIYFNKYSEKGLNQVSEVTLALQDLIVKLETGLNQNFLIEVVLREDFYLNIAKLRALRYLICKILAEFNTIAKFIIIAKSSSYNKSYQQEHNNLIRITTEALSGYMGMADVIEPGNYDRSSLEIESLNNSISRNVNKILEFESNINGTIDSTNGSYFLDKLTFDFINQVVDELDSNIEIDQLIAANKTSDELNLLSLKKTIIGVNKYSIKPEINSNISFDKKDLTWLFEKFQLKNAIEQKSIYYAFLCNPESISNDISFIEKLFKSLGFKVEIGTFLESQEDLQNVIEFNNFDIVLILADESNKDREIIELINSMRKQVITMLFSINQKINLPESVIRVNQSNLLESMHTLLEKLNRMEQNEI